MQTSAQEDVRRMLEELRRQQGYSYMELERLTGIGHATLQRYERGTNVSLTNIETIARAFGYEIQIMFVKKGSGADGKRKAVEP